MAVSVIGNRLKRLRQDRGLTQKQLADWLEINRSYLSQIENGHIGSVGGDILAALARGLRTSTDYLLGLTSQSWPEDNTTAPKSQLEYDLLDEFRKLKDIGEQRYALAQLQFQVRHTGPHRPRIIGDDSQEGED
jgi:transcriptional regulator with XRE-family HTH domain